MGVSCGSTSTAKEGATITAAPFCADSAYSYIAAQVAFGPRVPESAAHADCAEYLKSELTRHGATVHEQTGTLPNWEGKQQPIRNIIGQFNPERKNRVLLCAHWDSRPWADEARGVQPISHAADGILGANDGASGVGVLLEIARQLGIAQTKDGIDIVFFDVEDMGTPSWYTGEERENTWCLGSQLWAKKHRTQNTEHRTQNYQYGILLDMVGAPDAVFPKEYYSMQYAGGYVEKLWQAAQALGYGHLFHNEKSYPVMDDHYYVNMAGVPCVDIIHYNPRSETGFAPWWHTHNDNMNNVSASTLQAVGEVVLTAGGWMKDKR